MLLAQKAWQAIRVALSFPPQPMSTSETCISLVAVTASTFMLIVVAANPCIAKLMPNSIAVTNAMRRRLKQNGMLRD